MLGLPFEIIDFNLSTVLLAVVLGGPPLLVAGCPCWWSVICGPRERR